MTVRVFSHNFCILLCSAALAFLSVAALAQEPQLTQQRIIKLSPQQLEKIRLVEVAEAARLYTGIAFSKENENKMRNSLPLSEASLQAMLVDVRVRFQACMEGGFEARMENAFDAQVLRKTIQSVLTADIPEPETAKSIISAFEATDAYCATRVKIWTAAAIK